MAEGYDAVRESEQARRRLTELAREIGRRSTAEYVRGEAQALVREKSDQVRGAAIDRSRTFATRARETAVEKTMEYREKAVTSPSLLGIAGAMLGAAIGRSVAKKVRADRERERRYGIEPRRFEDRYGFERRNFSRAEYGAPGIDYAERSYEDMGLTPGIDRGPGTTGFATGVSGAQSGFANAYGDASIDRENLGEEKGRFTEAKESVAGKASHAKDVVSDRAAHAKEVVSDRAAHAKEVVSDKATHAKEVVSDRAAHAKEVVSDKASHAKEMLSSKAGHFRENARESFGHARQTMRHSMDTAKARASGMYERMPTRNDVSNYYHRTLDEQPWILAAAAIGLGLLAGLFLPESQAERRRLAPIKAKARDRFHEYTNEYTEKLEGMIGGEKKGGKKSDALGQDFSKGSFQQEEQGETVDLAMTGGDASAGGASVGDIGGGTSPGVTGGGAVSGSPGLEGIENEDVDVSGELEEEEERRDDQNRVIGTYEPPTIH